MQHEGLIETPMVLVLVGAAAADPRRGIEEEIEFPEIADALRQAPWLWVWALIRPGMIRRRASMTSAFAFLTALARQCRR
jgi:hypothetical protein